MTKQDDLNAPMIALVGFLGTVIVFVIVVFLVVVYRRVAAEQHYDKDISQPYGEITDLVTRQRDALASYGWVDRQKGIVSVPIGRAIDLVVGEIRATGQATVSRPEESAESPEETTAGPTEEAAEAPPNDRSEEIEEVGDAQPEP